MKVIFAKNIGFCFGVKRSIKIAQDSLEKDPKPIQFLGDLVHNEKVMIDFEKKGTKVLSDVGQARSGSLIIRAHGISPILEKRISQSVLVRDATCPLVKKAQKSAETLHKEGFQVVIIGDKNHPETKGIKGYTNNQAIIIENNEETETPSFLNKIKGKKIGVVAQTTKNLDKVKEILKILEKTAGELKWINTLCPEVATRQKEIAKILQEADRIIVIGSKHSANTKRLVERARELKRKVFWVDSLEELKKEKMEKISTLGVISGTSAPDWEIEKIKKWLLKDIKQK